jgi:hypothetical protein
MVKTTGKEEIISMTFGLISGLIIIDGPITATSKNACIPCAKVIKKKI